MGPKTVKNNFFTQIWHKLNNDFIKLCILATVALFIFEVIRWFQNISIAEAASDPMCAFYYYSGNFHIILIVIRSPPPTSSYVVIWFLYFQIS